MYTLIHDNTKYNIELWSYYTGGHNVAVNDFNKKNTSKIKYTGIAKDNYKRKIDTVIKTNDMPDIIMVDSTNLGQYLNSGAFVSFDEVFKSDPKYIEYLNNASSYGLEVGKFNKEQVAIKFENTSSVFVYRSDLAEKCLSVSNPSEMKNKLKNTNDLFELYDQLQSSDNELCKTSLLATTDFTKHVFRPSNVVPDNKLNKQIVEWFVNTKKAVDSGLIYSRYGNYHELVDNSAESNFLGDITTINQLRAFYDFNQPGKWSITEAPYSYQGDSAYFLISKNADYEEVKKFFDQTYFNTSWLKQNINKLGILENNEVMTNSKFTNPDLNSYFANSDLNKVYNQAIFNTNSSSSKKTPYDAGVTSVINGVLNEYLNGEINNNQILKKIKDDLEIFYQ